MKSLTLQQRLAVALTVCTGLFGAVGCHRNAAGPATADADDTPRSGAPISAADKDDKERDDALTLNATDIAKLGIVVSPIAAVAYRAEATGYGQVVGRDAVIQALSDIEVAQIRATQSRAALERSRKLAGTAGADAVTEQEAAVRQEAEDRAAIFLAQARMNSLLGQQAARALGADHALVEGLSAGRYRLVRTTLPLGAVRGDAPPALRLARLDAAPGEVGWRALRVWPAPVDATLPGRAFLALVDAPTLAEGERLVARAAAPAAAGEDEPLPGALVPASALVLTADDAWLYVEHDPGVFSRERLDTTRPLPAGYFVTGKLAAGTRVVTAGAGMLLSRELDLSPDD